MVQGNPHLRSPVLKDEDVADIFPPAQLPVAVPPDPDQHLHPLRGKSAQVALVVGAVDHHFADSFRREDGIKGPLLDPGSRRLPVQAGEAILKNGNFKIGPGYLRGKPAGFGGAQGAIIPGGKKGALHPVGCRNDPFPAQRVPSQL